jgi:hypothetical protein
MARSSGGVPVFDSVAGGRRCAKSLDRRSKDAERPHGASGRAQRELVFGPGSVAVSS